MKNITLLFLSLVIISLAVGAADAQRSRVAKTNAQPIPEPIRLESSAELQTLLDDAVGDTLKRFADKKVAPKDVAATLIDLRDRENLRTANYRGDRQIYPASVVKMFYLAAIHGWLETGKLKSLTPEIERGLKDMIVDSSNDATHFIVDVLTGTAGGGELSARELKIYSDRRNQVNRYFARLGYDGINVNQKTYCEDLYGRERQFWNGGKNRNMLTTNQTARLLAEIALGRFVSVERSQQMLDLMRRDFGETSTDADSQAHGFTALALNELNLKDAKLFSKAGWTSKTRHDAAYIETPDGRRFVLVVFTENFANEREIIPSIAGKILKNLK